MTTKQLIILTTSLTLSLVITGLLVKLVLIKVIAFTLAILIGFFGLLIITAVEAVGQLLKSIADDWNNRRFK